MGGRGLSTATGESYRIEPETGLVVFSSDGALHYGAWETAVLAALDNTPTAPSGRRFLSDRRRTQPIQSLALVERIMDFFRKYAAELGDMQWALLAPSESQNYGLFQLGEKLAKATRVRVKTFTDLKDALRWLLGAYDDEEVARLVRWIDSAA